MGQKRSSRIWQYLCTKWTDLDDLWRPQWEHYLTKWTPSAILYFWKFKILTAGTVQRLNLSQHVKFHAYGSKCCRDMAFFNFQHGGRLPSWICFAPVWTTHPRRLYGGLCHCAKSGWSQCSSFNILHIENAYLCPFGDVLQPSVTLMSNITSQPECIY